MPTKKVTAKTKVYPVQWDIYMEDESKVINTMDESWIRGQVRDIKSNPQYQVLLHEPDLFMFHWAGPKDARTYGNKIITYVRK